MKILFLLKFYQPFDRGGSEWSSHDLAKVLVKKGHDVTILTPNYGNSAKEETIENVKIVRFPFVKKLQNPKAATAPWWTNNMFWFAYTTLYISWFVFKHRLDVIHVQNNEFIPAGVIASKVNKKPSIVTFRDYQALCNLGFCLWSKDKTCKRFSEYLDKDFRFFYENYVDDKSYLKYLVLLMAAIRGWVMQKIIYYFARQADFKVAVSKRVSEIFDKNDISNLCVVHNAILVNNNPQRVVAKNIIYIGKLSPGKGVNILLDAYVKVQDSFRDLHLVFIGSGILKNKLIKKAEQNMLSNKVHFKGQISHKAVLDVVRKALFVVVPSVWPEPLPRSALEALLSGIPVIASDKGGTKEIVKEEYGITCKPNVNSLGSAILKMHKNRNRFRKNILKDLRHLRRHFSAEVADQYLKIYEVNSI